MSQAINNAMLLQAPLCQVAHNPAPQSAVTVPMVSVPVEAPAVAVEAPFNPFETKAAAKARTVILDLLAMSAQQATPGHDFRIRQVKPETVALGWREALKAMQKALDDAGKLGGIWLLMSSLDLTTGGVVEHQFLFYPKAVSRYSSGRLSPGDAFGRALWDLLRKLSSYDPQAPVSMDEAGLRNRLFGRLKAALDAFSLDTASRVGKSGKEFPTLTLRMMDWVEPGDAWVNPGDLAYLKAQEGSKCETLRHPLPTRARVTLKVAKWVPLGTVVLNSKVAQFGMSADADGDQVVLVRGWRRADHAVGTDTYLNGVPSIKDTALVSFLNPKHQTLRQKLEYKGMLRIKVDDFIATLEQLGEYSVSGIGQFGYNPSLANGMLALLREPGFEAMAGFGYRRWYEDTMLAGMTGPRWTLFQEARNPQGKNRAELQGLMVAAGVAAGYQETKAYCVGRLLAQAASQVERRGYFSRGIEKELGSLKAYVPLFGLLKALDAGRLDSVFIPQWASILKPFNQALPLIGILATVAPVAAEAAKRLKAVAAARAARQI